MTTTPQTITPTEAREAVDAISARTSYETGIGPDFRTIRAFIDQYASLSADRDRLQSRLSEAVERLKPFAEAAQRLGPMWGDGLGLSHSSLWGVTSTLSVGDLRAASNFVKEHADG